MEEKKSFGQFALNPIGLIRSGLTDLKDCPLQESEGAPEAMLEIFPSFAEGVKDFKVGDKIILLTWLHLGNRNVIKCHTRNEVNSYHFGVFSTRSPDRPNPIGLHEVTVTEIIDHLRIKIFPIEALNETPVIDIKPFI